MTRAERCARRLEKRDLGVAGEGDVGSQQASPDEMAFEEDEPALKTQSLVSNLR